MDDIVYTKEDLVTLQTMVAPGSVLEVYLEELDYDPEQFKTFLKRLPKQYKFLYQTDLSELPLMIDNPSIQGLINWRFSIGK